MSDETTLLPCPLCGGNMYEPFTKQWKNRFGDVSYSAWVKCWNCNLTLETDSFGYETEEAAENAVIAAWNTRAYLNPDGLPMGLTISDDGNLLNWRGENYVRQGTLGEQPAKSSADALSRRARDMARNIQGNLGRCLYRRKDVAEMEEVSETLMELADELNAKLGSDDDYERKMDTLLCRLTNGKWSKSRAYDLDFMESCVNEEFEALYSDEQFSAPVSGTLTAEQVQKVLYKHGINDGFVYSVIKGSFQAIADELNAKLESEINGETSDGYHTFNELYHHRAVLFSVIVRDHRELAWKARKHHDGTMYDGMFIVGIETPKGQATYHYDLDPYWEMFDCEEREFAPEWDGHTSDDAIARIAELGSEPPYDELLRCLEDDWHISASWDGLRKFWCIELTEEGVWMRDATLTAEQVSMHLKAMAYDLQTPNPFKSLEEKQAIVEKYAHEIAELESETCENTNVNGYDFCFECSECGRRVIVHNCVTRLDELPNYCPNCGTKVVS